MYDEEALKIIRDRFDKIKSRHGSISTTRLKEIDEIKPAAGRVLKEDIPWVFEIFNSFLKNEESKFKSKKRIVFSK